MRGRFAASLALGTQAGTAGRILTGESVRRKDGTGDGPVMPERDGNRAGVRRAAAAAAPSAHGARLRLTSSEAGGGDGVREVVGLGPPRRRALRRGGARLRPAFLPSMLFDTDFMSFWRGDVGGVDGDGSKGGDSERALCASTTSATTTTSDSPSDSPKLESVGVGECDRGDISMAKTSVASVGLRGRGRLT